MNGRFLIWKAVRVHARSDAKVFEFGWVVGLLVAQLQDNVGPASVGDEVVVLRDHLPHARVRHVMVM